MIKASVNHGRWIADCELCNGAESAKEGKMFLCANCGFKDEVKFPQYKSKIDELLRMRPEVNMNWEPGETLQDLKDENELHEVVSYVK